MVYKMSLRTTSNTSTVTFNPFKGYIRPDFFNEFIGRSLAGRIFIQQTCTKKRWEIPLQIISATNAVIINTWRVNNTPLRFIPDLINAPTTYYSVTIQNKEAALEEMTWPLFNNKWNGKLMLQEY